MGDAVGLGESIREPEQLRPLPVQSETRAAGELAFGEQLEAVGGTPRLDGEAAAGGERGGVEVGEGDQ